MPALPSSKTDVVRCKGCCRNIPSGTHGVPAQPIAVHCPLCGQRRMYLPVEVNLDRLHASLALRAEKEFMFPSRRVERYEPEEEEDPA
jgi:hypothetical protein